MKFTCSQGALARALNTVSKAVSARTTLPILKGILLKAEKNRLTITASDLDMSIETKMDIQTAGEGSAVVSARLFSDIVRKLPNAAVHVEEKAGKLEIKCLGSEFSIVCLPVEEFPSMGSLSGTSRIEIEKEKLRDIIRKPGFAASIDEKRGVLVGCLLEFTGETLEVAATDGFRLAIAREDVHCGSPKKVVIHARILGEINKLLMESPEEEKISLILEDKRAEIIMGETRIISRLLEGEFLKYNDIIPKTYNTRCVVSREDMHSSIERASLFSSEGKSSLIKMNIRDGEIEISSRSEEGNVKELVMSEKEGSDLVIGFNAKYMGDALKAVHDDEIVLEMGSEESPCVIKPAEGNKYTYLVLPVRIKIS